MGEVVTYYFDGLLRQPAKRVAVEVTEFRVGDEKLLSVLREWIVSVKI